MWWDNEKLLKQSKNTLNTKNYSGKSLFLTLANRMEKGVDTVLVQKDTAESTALIRANLKLIRYITATRQNQLRFKHKYYDDETHGSVPLISEYDAFRFIFDYYRFPKHNSYFTDTSIQLETVVAAHYNNVSQQMGYVVKPNESLVNNLGYRTLGEKQFDRAEKLFKLNIANYPESANVYDSLGDLYLAKGNKLKAIESFKKALTIAEVPETREKLTELLKQ
jgi:tetratricopeptide (TPR) repeat protein